MNIKDIALKHGLFLAPMAGITDRAYRRICRGFGAEFTVSEMLSAKAIHYGDRKTDRLAAFDPSDRPIALQIFGSEPDIMAEAAVYLEKNYSPDAIDINMGCPVHKIVGNGEGSALMKDVPLACEIVRSVKASVRLPVTVKLRSGWDENSVNAPYMAEKLQQAGADMITVHARTKSQLYAPPVDLTIIRDVKRSVTLPVVGNGGIEGPDDALRMLDETGCDGIMIARGSEGRPWIFAEIAAALEGKPYAPPDTDETLEIAREHIRLLVADKSRSGILEARKQIAWYLKGFPGAASLRGRINTASSEGDIAEIIDEIKRTVDE